VYAAKKSRFGAYCLSCDGFYYSAGCNNLKWYYINRSLLTNESYGGIDPLLQIARGDKQAFDRLFKAYFASLVLYAEKFNISREDAEDMAMQVLGKLWRERERIAEIKHLSAYLYSSVKNSCLDLLRSRKRAERLGQAFHDLVVEEDYAVREAVRAEVLRIINEQIKTLPEKYKIVFELTYYKGLNTREIARQLGLSETNVTTRRSRALLLLKKKVPMKDLYLLLLLFIQ
jgi:RNA polymerase sigma-70 factor (family 1)